MIDISKWAFENKKLIYFLIAVLIAGGAYSSYEMSKLEDPEITVKLAMVVTTYPGASAHQVELEVTDVLEKNIRSMGNIDNVESYSYNDLSLIQVELKTTVKETDVEQCWDLLRRKVANAQAELPEGASPSIVKDDFGNVYGMFFALTGDGLSDRELSDYSELIKREVSELDGVERVDLYGNRPECINISLLQDRMANLGVKPAEVLATLNGQNKTTYTGYYDNGDSRIRVTVSDKFKTVEDIGRMLIQGHDADHLRLSDIARIEKDYEDPTRNELFYDRQRAMGIMVAASPDADIIKVGKRVEQKLEQLKAERLPAGMECHKVFYQPERVGSSLGTFILNLIESVIIVVVILMVAPAFSAKDDIIYFSNAGFKLYRHIFSQNETEEVADIKEYVEDAGIYYNSLGVDPVSGEVYFATLKGYADYKTNDIAIFDFNKTPALQFDIKNKNSFPAGVFFTENFK